MKHPIRWLLGGLAVVLAAVVGFGAWYVFGDSAPAKPKLSTDAPADPSNATTPDGAWKVARGDQVYVGYRMTEQFAGDIVHKEAVGRTPAVDGTATIAGNKVTAADVTADMRELKSNRGARDNYIHTHGIESDAFPTAEFKLTSPITLPADVKKGAELLKVPAACELTLHGVTKKVTVPLDARWDGDTIEVVGTAPIVLADYKIEPPKTAVVKTDDHGSLELSLNFQRA
jgi:polyisoprenoid-binding protein YceI